MSTAARPSEPAYSPAEVFGQDKHDIVRFLTPHPRTTFATGCASRRQGAPSVRFRSRTTSVGSSTRTRPRGHVGSIHEVDRDRQIFLWDTELEEGVLNRVRRDVVAHARASSDAHRVSTVCLGMDSTRIRVEPSRSMNDGAIGPLPVRRDAQSYDASHSLSGKSFSTDGHAGRPRLHAREPPFGVE